MNSRVRINYLVLLVAAVLLLVSAGSAQTSRAVHSGHITPLTEAKAQLAKHDLKSAEDSVWKVLNSDPNSAEALLLLGVIRDEQQRYQEAEAVVLRAAQLDQKSASAHMYLGKTYLAENKLAEATEQYKAAEELSPRNVEVRVTLARLYAASGDFASALTALSAIPPASLPAEAIPVKVGSLVALGRDDEAVQLS